VKLITATIVALVIGALTALVATVAYATWAFVDTIET
jgi:hypothetical protein